MADPSRTSVVIPAFNEGPVIGSVVEGLRQAALWHEIIVVDDGSKIRGEQEKLAAERDDLQRTLASKAKLKRLVRDEIIADAERFGDERRSKLVERAAAQAIAETELVASEPVTVVLSRSGWVRAAKGHDIDPRALSYKTGDEYRAAAKGRSTQQAVFLDSTGRAYSLPAHTLPSARGQGEPLSGRLEPPDGATFPGVLIGAPDDRWVLAGSADYGFVP